MEWTSTASATSRALVAVVAAFFLLAASADNAAAEKKRVTVMKFKGPKSKTIRKGVLQVLKKKFKLVGQAKFVRAQKKLRARKINDRDVAEVAQSLEVHGVVFGKIKRKRGRYSLRLTLRAGADGSVVKDITVKLGKRPRLTKAKKRTIAKKLRRAINDLPDPVAEEEEFEEEEEAEEWEEYDDDSSDDSADDDGVEKGDDDDGDGDGDGDDNALSDKELFDALARDRAVDVAAGVSVIGRSLSFDVAAGIADEPNGYNGTLVPGAYVQGEIYPLAFNKKKKKQSPLAGIGVAFVVDKVLKISSKLDGGAVDIPTTQLRWGVGVRYRMNIGDKASGPTVKFGVGYNKLAFELDQQVIMDNGLDIDLPNVAYTYLDPGVAGRLPINRETALYADARFLIITDTGDIQQNDAYGPATVSGLDFDVGIEYRLDAHLLLRAGGRFQRISFAFDGTGALSDRDGDGNSDVSGANDQYLGGYAAAGYLF